ncbi:MAG TPA: METTL5 family protein [Thermoplasmata archaeon]|nr:METTL5 family protein [Thermoplasmata archaeon]
MTTARGTVRRSALVRQLESVPPFAAARAELEQVATPAEAAVELLAEARARDDLVGRRVADLGAGTGRLAIGAALWGAASVGGIETDPAAVGTARDAAARLGVAIDLRVGDVRDWTEPVDTVLMNPPFGAQRRAADRPFWATAFAVADRAVYAFGLAASRTFIAARAVERGAHVEANRPVRWELPRVFPHHRRARVALAVDLWVIRTKGSR